MAEAFVIDKEKSLGVCDGTAEGRAKIILDKKLGAAHVAEGMGVHGAIAEKFVSGAVELIGACSRDDIDLAAARAAHFRGVAAGLHFELLHGVGRGAEVERVESGIRIGDTVEEEVVSVGAVAADADGGPLARTPVERVHVAGLRAVADVGAGHSENEIDEHSAVQRKRFDGGGLDNFANAGVGGMQHVEQGGHDLQGAGGGSELEVEIEGELLVDLETKSLREESEACRLHGKFVIAGPQCRDFKDALLVADSAANSVRGGCSETNLGARDRIVLWVEDGATHNGEIALCKGARSSKQRRQQEESAHRFTPVPEARIPRLTQK